MVAGCEAVGEGWQAVGEVAGCEVVGEGWQAVGLHKAVGLELSEPQGAQAEGLVWPGDADASWNGPHRGPLTSGDSHSRLFLHSAGVCGIHPRRIPADDGFADCGCNWQPCPCLAVHR